jgi:hypothetical protein
VDNRADVVRANAIVPRDQTAQAAQEQKALADGA